MFVKSGELRAISQQYTNLDLKMNNAVQTLDALKIFFDEEIKPKIISVNWLSDCTLDVFIDEEKKEQKVDLIEMNPIFNCMIF